MCFLVCPARASGLAWRYGRGYRVPFFLLFAAAWILTEWLLANLFTGFAWNPLGVIWMAVPPLADSARWIGTYGLSGLTILIAGLFLLAASRPHRKAAASLALILALFMSVAALKIGRAHV